MNEHDQNATGQASEHVDHDFTGPLSPTVKKLLRVFFVISAILFLADFLYHRHTTLEAEAIPGFYAIYGFVGCVILVLVAKEMRKVVMRSESYYDSETSSEEVATAPGKPGHPDEHPPEGGTQP